LVRRALLPLGRVPLQKTWLLEGGEAAWAVDCGPWPLGPSNVHRPRTPVRLGGGVLSQRRNGSSRHSHGISHACLADGVPSWGGDGAWGAGMEGRGRLPIFFETHLGMEGKRMPSFLIKSHY
jgi:hypothetical protein